MRYLPQYKPEIFKNGDAYIVQYVNKAELLVEELPRLNIPILVCFVYCAALSSIFNYDFILHLCFLRSSCLTLQSFTLVFPFVYFSGLFIKLNET